VSGGEGPREADDATLVAAAQQGRVRALEQLLDRHQSRVLRILRLLGVPHQDRDDVAQEVFIRVFRHLGGFRSGQDFNGWIYRVTVNASHDYRSRRGRLARGEAPWRDEIDCEDPTPGPAEVAGQREMRRALEGALQQLSERERTIFVLRELEGLESREVARALGIHAITVRRHLSRARKRLRELLGDSGKKKSLSVERIVPDGGSHQ
jgi:RNA polymerase sigma-70 factor (ECF subfamily)